MKMQDREQKIIGILESRGTMSVNELSGMLGISVSTLRKQLSRMQANMLVIRTHGGAMSINPFPDETFDSKMHKSVAEKSRIAMKARSLVKNGETVALGSGTTVYALCNLLDDMVELVIYTDSMHAADYLAQNLSMEVHLCGGIIRSRTGTIIGNEACDYFSRLRVDAAFISCDAIDDNGIVYSDNVAVAAVESAVIRTARRRYVLCDTSKMGKKSAARITSLASCTSLITGMTAGGLPGKIAGCTDVIYV